MITGLKEVSEVKTKNTYVKTTFGKLKTGEIFTLISYGGQEYTKISPNRYVHIRFTNENCMSYLMMANGIVYTTRENKVLPKTKKLFKLKDGEWFVYNGELYMNHKDSITNVSGKDVNNNLVSENFWESVIVIPVKVDIKVKV